MLEWDGKIVQSNCPFYELSAYIETENVEPKETDQVKVVHRCCNEHAWGKLKIKK